MAVSALLTDIADIDHSPHAKMQRLLDDVYADIQGVIEARPSNIKELHTLNELRTEARGIAKCIAIVMCCTVDEVREATQIRWEERLEAAATRPKPKPKRKARR